MIYFYTFTKLPKNVRDLGKISVAKSFKNLPKGQKIAQSGHTGCSHTLLFKDISIYLKYTFE